MVDQEMTEREDINYRHHSTARATRNTAPGTASKVGLVLP